MILKITSVSFKPQTFWKVFHWREQFLQDKVYLNIINYFFSFLFKLKILRAPWNYRFELIYFEGEDKHIVFTIYSFTQNQSENFLEMTKQVTCRDEKRQFALLLGCTALKSNHKLLALCKAEENYRGSLIRTEQYLQSGFSRPKLTTMIALLYCR